MLIDMETVYTRQDLVTRMNYICVFLLVTQAAQTSAQCTVGYTGEEASLWCTCNAGYTGGNFIGPYSQMGKI
jgi:hypothetical protein